MSAWAVLNLIPSTVIVVSTIFLGGHTPALYLLLTEEEVDALAPEVLATMDSIAVFANGANIAFCLLAVLTIWSGLRRRQVWAFWALLAGFTLALVAAVGADYVVGTAAPLVNVISGSILALGLAASAAGLFRSDEKIESMRCAGPAPVP